MLPDAMPVINVLREEHINVKTKGHEKNRFCKNKYRNTENTEIH